ncbi:unnamed protein product [Paramecium sonneborni]|uniref:Uncharacterized protein n=1 Tax=Paramecium sonneborni TaxID=65129 RepID=A0A8S1QDW9_9CILI|nr:unnamed protein product [Paramecium sonneborni]
MGCCLTKKTKHTQYSYSDSDESPFPIQQYEESNYKEVSSDPIITPKEQKIKKLEQEYQITWDKRRNAYIKSFLQNFLRNEQIQWIYYGSLITIYQKMEIKMNQLQLLSSQKVQSI